MAKINIINAKRKYEGAIHAAIYCRVSTAHKAQLNSLTAQISGLTNKIAYMPNYVLFDSYVDIASGVVLAEILLSHLKLYIKFMVLVLKFILFRKMLIHTILTYNYISQLL